MAKKFLVLLMALAILFAGIAATPVKANSELLPDIVTDKILILPFRESILNELKNGTLGIVSYSYKDNIGFDIPGGNIGTDILIKTKMVIPVTTPVALQLVKGTLYVYFSKIEVNAIKWDILSVPPTELAFSERSWFPKFIPLQIVKAIPEGVETQTNYCCNPPIKKISYGYKLYLSICKNPYSSPDDIIGDPVLYLNQYFMVEVMIPDYLRVDFERIIDNKDFIWVGLSGSSYSLDYNYIYFWSH